MTDMSQWSMHDLFRVEAESQSQVLTAGLLALERDPAAADQLEACMRAAHSLKGAARIVDIDAGVALAHAMEDFLVAAQEGRVAMSQAPIDILLRGVDLMMAIANDPDVAPGQASGARRFEIDAFVDKLQRILRGEVVEAPAPVAAPVIEAAQVEPEPEPEPEPIVAPTAARDRDPADRALRVTVENLNRLLGLAGESLVESRWLKPFGQSLQRLKRLQFETGKAMDRLSETLALQPLDDRALGAISEVQRRLQDSQQFLADRLAELDVSDRRSTSVAHRLYDQALACRMQPFSDGVLRFPRMVRDVGRSLGKNVRMDIIGAATQVDRDILERLDAPLGHLLRNAVDHGIESADERAAAGKPAEGVVTLEARHSAGALQIVVSDDGRGIDVERLRAAVIRRKHATAETAARLSEAELLEFLFLPGFTLKDTVTEISGRGVGLDVVQDMLKSVRGVVRITTQPGVGSRFVLQLPLTLSVVRTLLVEIGGEPYAFPLAYIARAVTLKRSDIAVLEGRQHFDFDGEQLGLVTAHQVLDAGEHKGGTEDLSVVVVGDHHGRYGVVVDRFLGGRELVVQPLDPRLGKIKDINAAALMEDGSPVLIVDVEDMIRSMEKLAHADRLSRVRRQGADEVSTLRKRVLVVDDSLTVRELQRKLLDNHGYEVDVAVDGMDGWQQLRAGRYDLVVTDIDMPRMDGVELVELIRKDPTLKSLPVMIVSYKDREEDRRRGLDAGADYYLTKGSFQDDTLLNAVADLIGEAAA
jgi:two-component system sensor histidine kinase and response regulator WspE